MLERVDTVEPKAYEKASRTNMGPEHKVSAYGVPGADPRKTTQGLWYTSYGMDERDKRRWYLETGGSWRIRLTARGLDPATTPQVVLEQAKAALWLLCNYGGVGSKARKGFGSLTAADFDGWGLADCQRAAAELREQIGLPNRHQDGLAESSSLQQSLGVCEVPFHWPDVWHVLDQIGFAYQAFSQRYKHRLEKKALGLPRRVGRPCSGHFAPSGPVKRLLDDARSQRREENVRHASPIHIHVYREANGFLVRVLAFPAAYLPNLATSRGFLQEFLDCVEADLKRRGLSSRRLPRLRK